MTTTTPATVRSVMLNMTNLEANNNKFYFVAIDQDPHGYRVRSLHGRVGVEGIEVIKVSGVSLDSANREFDKLVRSKEKTGYRVVNTDLASETRVHTPSSTSNPVVTPKLSPQKTVDSAEVLLHIIFEESQRSLGHMLETPLGKLTMDQIQQGYGIIDEIRSALRGPSQSSRLVHLSGDFYTAIPHRLRKKDLSDAVLDTPEKVAEKALLLQNMIDYYRVQNVASAEAKAQMESMGLTLTLAKPAITKKLIHQIMESKSSRHTFPLKPLQVFEVQLQSERKKDLTRVGNIRTYYHGTSNKNVLGILQHGLLAKPVGVSGHGSAFGSGIYFADQSSKSAQYSLRTSVHHPINFLFIAEVAMGKMYVPPSSHPYTQAPAGYDSLSALTGETPYLTHNEFIVFNPDQARLRYVVTLADPQRS